MTAHSESSSEGESSSPPGPKPSNPSPNASLRKSRWRWPPLVWQIGGTLVSVSGFVLGTNTLADVGLHLAIYSFITAIYLSWFIRDDHRRQNLMAVLGYLLYSAGFALVSGPNRFEFGEWTPVAYALGALSFSFLLPLTWFLFTGYLFE